MSGDPQAVAQGHPDEVLPEIRIIEPQVFADPRGFFVEVFNARRFTGSGRREADSTAASTAAAGQATAAVRNSIPFVQINQSRSVKGTLRGLHFQEPNAQGKLVWAASGEVFDVAVDVRRGSPSFGRWTGLVLSDDNHRQLWIPSGFAHGFCVLSEIADFMYACTEFYSPADEHAVRWNDPEIAIEWPVAEPTLSDKDRNAPLLADAPVLPEYLVPGG